MKLLIIFSIAFLSFGASASSSSISFELSVGKRVVLTGESSEFAAKISLPCSSGGCGEVAAPKDMAGAISQLESGFDNHVLDIAVKKLKMACGGVGRECSPRDPAMWEAFYESLRQDDIEPDHTFGEYFSQLNYSLSYAWYIERGCSRKSLLCNWFSSRMRASPYMISEIIVRGFLLTSAGIDYDINDIVSPD